MVSTEDGLKFIREKENRDNLKEIGKQLYAVKNRSGFFNIARLRRYGLIKEFVTCKGKMCQGSISGRKSYYVLTEKGKRTLNGILYLL